MKVNMNSGRPPRKIIPKGTYNVILCGYYYIGTQRSDFKGEVKIKPEIVLAFDVPKIRVEWEGRDAPARMNAFAMTLSIGRKAKFRGVVKAILGRDLTPEEEAGFTIDSLLGKPLSIRIDNYEGREKRLSDKIVSYGEVDADKPIPKLETKTFGLSCIDEVTQEPIIPTVEAGWPRWVIKKCYNSEEFKRAIAAGKIAAQLFDSPYSAQSSGDYADSGDDDEVPF